MDTALTIIMRISERGRDFVALHEGFVSRAYRCPAGVVTIGYGFTNGSVVFRRYWQATRGRELRMGDTITREEADRLLTALLDEEYGAAVARGVEPRRQNHFDGATSMTFNCGPGALSWRWAQALRRGDVAEAARLLRTTATTANGRTLPGLVRRRAEEADLVQHGIYKGLPRPAAGAPDDEVRWVQTQLAALGFDPGPIDGLMGPRTRNEVKAFQLAHRLVVDGIPGPATRAAIVRALDARASVTAAAGAGAGGAATGGAVEGVPLEPEAIASAGPTVILFALAAVVVVIGAAWLWRNRGRITGHRVPT